MTRIETNRFAIEHNGKVILLISLGTTYVEWLKQASNMGQKPFNYVFAWIFDQYDSAGESGLHTLINEIEIGKQKMENKDNKEIYAVKAELSLSMKNFRKTRNKNSVEIVGI